VNEDDAIVTRVDGGHVWVDIGAASSCASCDQAAGCADSKGRAPQRLPNTIGARVGDRVSISAPAGAVLRAVCYSYLIPLALVLASAATGMAVGGEQTAVLGAMFGLLVGWLVLRRASRGLAAAREPLLTMRIKGVVVHHLHRNRTP
jgi:positive regulator of sigma E activity